MSEFFLAMFIALQVADVWTTDKALRLGKREMNPFLNYLFKHFDPIFAMVMVKLPAVWLLWKLDLYFLTAGACILYLWVVLNNLDVIEDK